MSLRRRLARIEQTLADRIKQRELDDCICGGPCIAIPGPENEDHFEAEINRPCPVHGLRRFDSFIQLGSVNPDGTPMKFPRLDKLVEEYFARLEAAEKMVTANDPEKR
jgi:hypothetical protein